MFKSIFDDVVSFFSEHNSVDSSPMGSTGMEEPSLNPMTGIPMCGDSGLDVCGNPYGMDLSHDTSTIPDSWSSDSSLFSADDNSFSSSSDFDSGSSWD